MVGYALAVAAAWTGKNTDTAESLGLTAFFTILLAIVFALAATP